VSPPVLYGAGWWANRIANKPHLASLAGYVRDLVEVLTLELDRVTGPPDEHDLTRLDRALTGDVALVGVSSWTSLHPLGAVAIIERVRRLRPDVPIVVGGHHATACPEDYDGLADWVVRHDGERPLRALCERPPARPRATTVLDGGAFDQGADDPIDWDRYGPEDWERALWVGTSRGCAFRCRFCVEPDRGASYSRYSVERQIDILERLVQRHAPRVIAFSDPLFGNNRAWLTDLLERLRRRALPVMFWCETRADLMTPELLELFLANEFMVDFGLDAACPEMVATMHKAARPEVYLARARATFEHANRIGLHHGVYLIFNFPGETPETTRATQAWIEALGAGPGPMAGWLSCQTFFVLPGTDVQARMAEHAATLGTRVRHPAWWREAGDHYTLATDVLPSAAWLGREAELTAFRAWNARINAAWAARYPSEVAAFRARFYLG